ncbi:MAG: DNA-directed RNA polymerase subunit omega [Thermotogae bacterium]|nr:DNA-directed RNA polymerase subunit omega [Thermotogota bacterium]
MASKGHELELNYDKLLERIPYKYAIPIAVARRAEAIKEFAKPLIKTRVNHPIIIALKELELGKIRIKNEDVLKILKAEVR